MSKSKPVRRPCAWCRQPVTVQKGRRRTITRSFCGHACEAAAMAVEEQMNAHQGTCTVYRMA